MLMDEMNFKDKMNIENWKIEKFSFYIFYLSYKKISCAFVNITFIFDQKIEISWILFAWK